MRLRKLQFGDAELMLEWMHDTDIVKHLQTDFMSKTIEDCKYFIKMSMHDEKNIHRAIVNEEDIYMGTVSLKNIEDDCAEFGITVRTAAMGKGYSKYAIMEMLSYGFKELNLKKIFWCVSPLNLRAVRFYDKNNFSRVDMREKKIIGYTDEQVNYYIWYEVNNSNFVT